MRPSGQIVLQETIRRLPVVIPASVLTASDPLLRSVDATTDIVTAIGGGSKKARIYAITCDGKGNVLPGAIVRIGTGTAIKTGMATAAVVTLGTPVNRGNYTDATAAANLGGFIEVASDANAKIDVAIEFNAIGLKTLSLQYMFATMNGAITVS